MNNTNTKTTLLTPDPPNNFETSIYIQGILYPRKENM